MTLPLPVDDEVELSRSPHLRQLEQIASRHVPVALAILDWERSRLFNYETGVLTALSDLTSKAQSTSLPKLWGLDFLIDRQLNRATVLYFHRVGSQLEQLMQESGCKAVVLSGSPNILAALEGKLSPSTQKLIIKRLNLATSHRIIDLQTVMAELEELALKKRKAAELERLHGAITLGIGEAVTGVNDVLEGLSSGSARDLFVSDSLTASAACCPACAAW